MAQILSLDLVKSVLLLSLVGSSIKTNMDNDANKAKFWNWTIHALNSTFVSSLYRRGYFVTMVVRSEDEDTGAINEGMNKVSLLYLC